MELGAAVLDGIKCQVLSDKEIGKTIAILLGDAITSKEDCCTALNAEISGIKDALDSQIEKLDTTLVKLEELRVALENTTPPVTPPPENVTIYGRQNGNVVMSWDPGAVGDTFIIYHNGNEINVGSNFTFDGSIGAVYDTNIAVSVIRVRDSIRSSSAVVSISGVVSYGSISVSPSGVYGEFTIQPFGYASSSINEFRAYYNPGVSPTTVKNFVDIPAITIGQNNHGSQETLEVVIESFSYEKWSHLAASSMQVNTFTYSTYCQGIDLYSYEDDGYGNTRDILIEANSPSCGGSGGS